MIRTRHRLLASLAAVVAMAVAAEASATSLLQLDYNAAKDFGSVHIAGGAIDLTSGAMIVTTSSFGFVPSGGQTNEIGSPGVAEYGDVAIHDAIVEGQNLATGYYNGTNGIYSSTAANDPAGITGVGWIDNDSSVGYSTFRGVTVPPGSSIIAYTYLGDTDLSGVVDSGDYLQLTNLYGQSTGGYLSPTIGVDWFDGDTDYSGVIDSSDYINLTNTYHAPALYTAGPVVPAAAVAVPEPTSIVLIVATAILGLGFRHVRKFRS